LIDCKEKKLEEMTKRLEQIQHDLTTRESNLKDRETRVFEAEPFLGVAKELQNLGIDMGLALPWVEVIRRKAEAENVDIRACATILSQELVQYGSLQKQIESANQGLALINMATIQKKQALTLLMDLSNRGVTESQIVQLIDFAGEWQKYWSTTTTDGKNNLQQPSNGNNGYGDGNLSMNDLISLNLLKGSTTNMLNRIRTTHMPSSFHSSFS
jgi:hypothetical protein